MTSMTRRGCRAVALGFLAGGLPAWPAAAAERLPRQPRRDRHGVPPGASGAIGHASVARARPDVPAIAESGVEARNGFALLVPAGTPEAFDAVREPPAGELRP